MFALVIARSGKYLKHNSHVYLYGNDLDKPMTHLKLTTREIEWIWSTRSTRTCLHARRVNLETNCIICVYLYWPQISSYPARMDLYKFDGQICLAYHVKHYSRERVVLRTSFEIFKKAISQYRWFATKNIMLRNAKRHFATCALFEHTS